jgi:hypothetical protein
LGVGAQGIYYAIEVVAREPGRGRTDHEIVAGQRALVPVPPSAR